MQENYRLLCSRTCRNNVTDVLRSYLFRFDNMKKRRYLRQGVQITGISSATFKSIVAELEQIHTVFERYFSPGTLRPWVAGSFQEHAAIDISNRYLTPVKDAAGIKSVVPPPEIDPQRILQQIKGSEFIHCTENEVLYGEVIGDGGVIR